MLKKSADGWVFAEEYLLEDFIWKHLKSTLNLIPLKRQLHINGEYCDILAKTNNNQLVVLELKNCEDRYIIHQLTRYYHNLVIHQPLKEEVDYSLPIRLVAIAPSFHKHNLIDQQYSNLNFELIRFQIIEKNNKFCLWFTMPDHQKIQVKQAIDFSLTSSPDQPISISPPPKFLLNYLDKMNDQTKRKVLEIRDKILTKYSIIKEVKVNYSLVYQCSKDKPCTQIMLVKGNEIYSGEIRFFLFLPLPKNYFRRNSKTNIGRVLVLTDKQFNKTPVRVKQSSENHAQYTRKAF